MFFIFITATNDFQNVLQEVVHLEENWDRLSDALGLQPHVCGAIKKDHLDCRSCLRAVIMKWLSKAYDFEKHGCPSWQTLVKAVAEPIGCNDKATAMKIAKNHDGECSLH